MSSAFTTNNECPGIFCPLFQQGLWESGTPTGGITQQRTRFQSNKLYPPRFTKRASTTLEQIRGQTFFVGAGNTLIVYDASSRATNHQSGVRAWPSVTATLRVGRQTHFNQLKGGNTYPLQDNNKRNTLPTNWTIHDKISYHHSNFDAHPTCILTNASRRRYSRSPRTRSYARLATSIGRATSRVEKRTERITVRGVCVGTDISKGDLDRRRGDR